MAQRLTTSQLRTAWGNRCAKASERVTIQLHSGAAITVHQLMGPTFRCVDVIMARHGYHPPKLTTGGFHCRTITGGSGLSLHGIGIAVDYWWDENPYRSDNKLITNMPPEMVDEILDISLKDGTSVLRWGGNYRSIKDAMHYEGAVSPIAMRMGLAPKYQDMSGQTPTQGEVIMFVNQGDTGEYVKMMQLKIKRAGVDIKIDGNYGPKTAEKLAEAIGSSADSKARYEYDEAVALDLVLMRKYGSGGGGGGMSQADGDARYAPKSHGHSGTITIK